MSDTGNKQREKQLLQEREKECAMLKEENEELKRKVEEFARLKKENEDLKRQVELYENGRPRATPPEETSGQADTDADTDGEREITSSSASGKEGNRSSSDEQQKEVETKGGNQVTTENKRKLKNQDSGQKSKKGKAIKSSARQLKNVRQRNKRYPPPRNKSPCLQKKKKTPGGMSAQASADVGDEPMPTASSASSDRENNISSVDFTVVQETPGATSAQSSQPPASPQAKTDDVDEPMPTASSASSDKESNISSQDF